jgi:hypothetical protein
MDTTRSRTSLHLLDLVPLAIGFGALVAGTAVGWRAGFVDAIVSPPAVVRAALIGVAVVVALALLAAAVRRLQHDARGGAPDLPRMIRGIRLVFLAVAAFAAAVAWIVANPLPIVVALVIAGVDVVETSFLLLVVAVRRP